MPLREWFEGSPLRRSIFWAAGPKILNERSKSAWRAGYFQSISAERQRSRAISEWACGCGRKCLPLISMICALILPISNIFDVVGGLGKNLNGLITNIFSHEYIYIYFYWRLGEQERNSLNYLSNLDLPSRSPARHTLGELAKVTGATPASSHRARQLGALTTPNPPWTRIEPPSILSQSTSKSSSLALIIPSYSY
jgi:hypothetical protein